jgi:hypothetical protein
MIARTLKVPNDAPARPDPRRVVAGARYTDAVLALQRSAGNAAVTRMLARRLLQRDVESRGQVVESAPGSEALYTPSHPEREASFSESASDAGPVMSRDPQLAVQVASTRWAIMGGATISGGVWGGAGGVTFTLKNLTSGVMVPLAFSGVGLETPGAGITVSDPSWTDFTTEPVRAADFGGRAEIVSLGGAAGVGGSFARLWFHNVDTDPEPLDVGGLQYGFSLGLDTLIGSMTVDTKAASF